MTKSLILSNFGEKLFVDIIDKIVKKVYNKYRLKKHYRNGVLI